MTLSMATEHYLPWMQRRRDEPRVCVCGARWNEWGSCDVEDRWRRHEDQSITRSFTNEAEAWLASWYEAPCGYDDEMIAEAVAHPLRLAHMLRWTVDHITYLESGAP